MTEEPRTRVTQLRTVGVPVTDQDRALDFYAGTLGLEKRLDAPFGDGGRWIEVAPSDGTTTIALVAESANQPTGHDTGIRLTVGDAAAKHADLLARGVDADPEVLRWPGVPAMFAFRDPDGNTLEIVEGA
jgi:catechol 2,3-dioxygenase-like lactoylglutathione lyase family enzyme